MLKKSLKSIIVSSILLGTSMFANDIIVDKDSSAGTIILKSDAEYKEYLSKVANNKELEGLLYKQECDINMLKAAVAKLIKDIDSLSNNKEVEKIKSKISEIEKQKEIAKEKISQKNIPEAEISNLDRVINSKEMVPLVEKKVKCKKMLVENNEKKEYSEDDVKGSYIKYVNNKEYKVLLDNTEIFKLPLVNTEVEERKLNKGDSFIADKYTKAGWVHIKDGGWVKGYILYPKVEQEPVDNVKFVEECK